MKLLKFKGFTLTEMLVALLLVGLLLSAVVTLVSFVTSTYTSNSIEDSLHSVSISKIEELNHALSMNKTLECSKFTSTGDIGSVHYSLIATISDTKIKDAFRITITATASTGESITNEVILYEDSNF